MLKRFKQEMLFLPIMLILIQVFRMIVQYMYPDTALFDRGSELETYLVSVWKIVWITCAVWLLLRVSFPSVHKSMCSFYTGFERLSDDEQRSIALKFFLAFFFGLVFLMSGRAQTESNLRLKLKDTLTSQLYVREATGHNDGTEVERYLKFVGATKGAAWCAAFASWNLNAVGIPTPPNPRSAWSPTFSMTYIVWSAGLEKQHKAGDVKVGDCFTLYYSNIGRVGHVGFITGMEGNYYITIEGNSGSTGSREGEGVHKYKRDKRKVYTVTDYLSSVKYKPPNKGSGVKISKL